jgi:ribonuclease HI
VSAAVYARSVDGDPVLAEVIALELRLLQPDTRADRRALECLLHPDFREIGASGRLWDRNATIAALAAEPGERHVAHAVEAHRIAADAVLVTYATESSRRSSLWVRDDDRWQVRFHQGTPTSPDG